uniref:NADH dehydrogenase subunit 5 n=1 Tax=Pelodiscus sinensis TaxID=13735 RepID=W6AW66_PELSI|nr:NADH dehydrogenase subunit 5 [Pelodiscus sinensis]
MGQPRFQPMLPINENYYTATSPIIRLAAGSIIAGLLISLNTTPMKTPQMTMPHHMKLSALIMTIMGLTLALELITMTNKSTKPSKPHTFSNLLMYFNTLIHRSLTLLNLKFSQNTATHLTDLTWYENIGPKWMTKSQTNPITTMSSQKGLIKIYLTSFLLSITMLLLT